eukprot:bmy_14828T0
MNVQRDEHQPHWKSRGGLWARSQRSTRTLYTGHGDRALPGSAGSRSDVQDGHRQHWTADSDPGLDHPALRLPQACHCRCRRHAAPQDGIPLDSAPGRRLLGSEGSETPSAPVPHQHHPAQGQLRHSAGRLGGAGAGAHPAWQPPSPHARTWPVPSFQGPGSLWPWPPRAAPCRSRATGLRPPHCM